MAASELFEALREELLVISDLGADRRDSVVVEEHILDGGEGIMALGSMTGVVDADIVRGGKGEELYGVDGKG